MRYDPDIAPNPQDWLSLDEGERIALVVRYHKKAGDKVPNVRLHAAIHTAVENQITEDITEVTSALKRLMKEGLHRHDAVHAVGSVLVKQIYKIGKGEATSSPNAEYLKDLGSLTASSWLSEPR